MDEKANCVVQMPQTKREEIFYFRYAAVETMSKGW